MRVAKVVLAIVFPLTAWPLCLNLLVFGRSGVVAVISVISVLVSLTALASAFATDRSARFLLSANLLFACVACCAFLGYVKIDPESVFRGTDPSQWGYVVYAALVAPPILVIYAWRMRFGLPDLLRATWKTDDADSTQLGPRQHVPEPWELDPLNHPVILSRTQSPLRNHRAGEDAKAPSSETDQ